MKVLEEQVEKYNLGANLEEDFSNILLHGHWLAKKIESSFTDYASLKAQNVFNSSSIGITALARLVESNKLTPESIRNYAKPVLKQRIAMQPACEEVAQIFNGKDYNIKVNKEEYIPLQEELVRYMEDEEWL